MIICSPVDAFTWNKHTHTSSVLILVRYDVNSRENGWTCRLENEQEFLPQSLFVYVMLFHSNVNVLLSILLP